MRIKSSNKTITKPETNEKETDSSKNTKTTRFRIPTGRRASPTRHGTNISQLKPGVKGLHNATRRRNLVSSTTHSTLSTSITESTSSIPESATTTTEKITVRP